VLAGCGWRPTHGYGDCKRAVGPVDRLIACGWATNAVGQGQYLVGVKKRGPSQGRGAAGIRWGGGDTGLAVLEGSKYFESSIQDRR